MFSGNKPNDIRDQYYNNLHPVLKSIDNLDT